MSPLLICILSLAASLLAACAGSAPATSSSEPAVCGTAPESVECAAARESLALSPDRARFLSYSVAGGYSDAELEVWRIAAGLPELELRVRPRSWDPDGAYWSGATRITVPPQRGSGEAAPWEARIRVELADGVWTIYSEARCNVSSGCS